MTKWYSNDESAADEMAKNNPCQDCGSTNVEVRFTVTSFWRGWQVECMDCGNLNEYDMPESPAEHRSV